MVLFEPRKDDQLWRFGWRFLFSWVFLAAIFFAILSAVFTETSGLNSPITKALWLVTGVLFASGILAGFSGLLLLLFEIAKSIKVNGEKMENTIEMINRNRSLLKEISQGIRLSNDAKQIVFRDTDRTELQEAVLNKLHQHDFDTTFVMIENMRRNEDFVELAQELEKIAGKYRNSTEEARIKQAISYIEGLFEKHKWSAASAQIENLLKTFNDSELVQDLPRRLTKARDNRKADLLAKWDEAVKREDVDLSLEILKELDLYLTPNEALALQESASQVYRTKLHNLGVQFSLAVTEKQWDTALKTGQQIIRQFPNSRMAHEIRAKMDVLHLRSQEMKKNI